MLSGYYLIEKWGKDMKKKRKQNFAHTVSALAVIYSFTNYDGWKTMDFIGLNNYRQYRD